MATLILKVENSKFVSHNGVNVEVFTENEVEGNDWECTISENGRIDCIATKFYYNERHQMKFKIDNGWVKLLLKINDDKPKVLKCYKIDDWPINGTLVLPDGYIDKRKPRFRTADLQHFLEEYSITAIRNQDPNRIYTTMQDYNGSMFVFKETIKTNGNAEVIFEETNADERYIKTPFVKVERVEITGATWVLKTVYKKDKILHNILYTDKDLQVIVDLPKIY